MDKTERLITIYNMLCDVLTEFQGEQITISRERIKEIRNLAFMGFEITKEA